VLTKVDRDRDDREQQGCKEKGTQVFADDISVERKQDYTWFGFANIGNKRLQAPTYGMLTSFDHLYHERDQRGQDKKIP
jgi:hypothetical protein